MTDAPRATADGREHRIVSGRLRLTEPPANSERGAVRGLARYLELDAADASTFVVRASRGGERHANPQLEGAPATVQDSTEALCRLKRMAGFESQDFDPVDNDIQREFEVNRALEECHRAEVWRWLLAALIGASMGVISFLVDWAIEWLNDRKYDAVQQSIAGGGRFWEPLGLYLCFTSGYATMAGLLVSYLEPLAAGSGISELKTYLNGIHIRGLLTVRALFAKLLGIAFSIGAGLVAGKEGAFVHGGGAVGGGIAGMGSMTLTTLTRGLFRLKLPRSWGGYFRNDADHRDFTAIGTAAGMATAFAAPIGGLLFAIEEGASFYSTSVFWRGFLATCMGVMTLHFLVEMKNGGWGVVRERLGVHRDFGLYNDIQASYGAIFFYYVWELPIFMLLGCAGGLLGSLFIAVNVEVTRLRHRLIPVRMPGRRLLEVVGIAMATSALFFCITFLSPCVDTPPEDRLRLINVQERLQQPNATAAQLLLSEEQMVEVFYQGGGSTQHFPQLWCPEDQFNVYGQIFFVPLAQSLRLIIHLGEPLERNGDVPFEFDLRSIALFFFVCFALMTWTYGIGAATGLFVPSLAVGAAGGRLFGRLVKVLARSAGFRHAISLSSYAVIGAAASLGGVTRLTLSISVLIMETTGSLQLVVPIMLAVFFAKVVGDRFGLGIYDTHIKIRGAPVLGEPNLTFHQKMLRDKLNAKELMTSELTALPPQLPLRQLVETLRSCGHQLASVLAHKRRAGAAPGMGSSAAERRHTASRQLGRGHASAMPATSPPAGPTAGPPQASRAAGSSKQAFPVTPATGRLAASGGGGGDGFQLHGVILRTQLLRMLRYRIGLYKPHASAAAGGGAALPTTQAGRLRMLELCEQIPIKIREKEEQHLVLVGLEEEEELDTLWMDLRPFMQRHPHLIGEDASIARTYRLFRTMGLRHLFVCPEQPRVLGIVTRKDVTLENCSLALGEKAQLSPSQPNSSASPVAAALPEQALPFLPYSPYDASAKPFATSRRAAAPPRGASTPRLSARAAAAGGGSAPRLATRAAAAGGAMPSSKSCHGLLQSSSPPPEAVAAEGGSRRPQRTRHRGNRGGRYSEWGGDAEERPLLGGSIELQEQR